MDFWQLKKKFNYKLPNFYKPKSLVIKCLGLTSIYNNQWKDLLKDIARPQPLVFLPQYVCISNKFSSGAETTGPQTTLGGL